MSPQGLNCAPNGITEANRDLWKIQRSQIITKLSHYIVAGRLPIRNLHELWRSLLWAASRASVCWFTEPQNSSSVISFDASPSASRVSSSSGVPEKPGRQGGLHDFFYRLVAAAANDSLNSTLLFWREMDRHISCFPAFNQSQSTGKACFVARE